MRVDCYPNKQDKKPLMARIHECSMLTDVFLFENRKGWKQGASNRWRTHETRHRILAGGTGCVRRKEDEGGIRKNKGRQERERRSRQYSRRAAEGNRKSWRRKTTETQSEGWMTDSVRPWAKLHGNPKVLFHYSAAPLLQLLALHHRLSSTKNIFRKKCILLSKKMAAYWRLEWRVMSHTFCVCCYPASQFLCFGSQDSSIYVSFYEPPPFRTTGPHPLYKTPQRVRSSRAYFYT